MKEAGSISWCGLVLMDVGVGANGQDGDIAERIGSLRVAASDGRQDAFERVLGDMALQQDAAGDDICPLFADAL